MSVNKCKHNDSLCLPDKNAKVIILKIMVGSGRSNHYLCVYQYTIINRSRVGAYVLFSVVNIQFFLISLCLGACIVSNL